MTFEQLIRQQQSHIDRAIQDLARQHFLAAAEIEEFRSAVERALERHDYELLRAFDGRSTWETYLTTVITRQFFLFQAMLWGPWRPSPLALRLGAAAILLEELVVRNRFTVNDAVDWMRTTHRVDLPRHRLLQMAEQLDITDTEAARRRMAARTAASCHDGLNAALRDALALLSPDDRLIVELRFRDRQPLTRVAALMRIEARTLQRRLETIKEVIRQSLLTQGIAADDIETLLSSADRDVAHADQRRWVLALTPATDRGAER